MMKRNVAFVARALATTLLIGVAVAAGAAAKPNSHAGLDCNFCHLDTPRFGVDTLETVNFWRAEGDEPQLCDRCHGPETNFHPLGVTPDRAHLGTQAPAALPLGTSEAVRGQVVCITCHFVHAADADYGLLRGFPGSSDPGRYETRQDLCRDCHGAGLVKRSPHTGDDRACAFCHSSKPKPDEKVTLTSAGSELCGFCHGNKDKAHYAGVDPFGAPQQCTGCHDPHLGKDHPARLKASYFDTIREAVTFNPHRKRVFCFACHAGEKPGALRDADVVALCQRCHGSGKILSMYHPMKKASAGSVIPQGWPLADGTMTCLTCHFAGHAPGTVAGRPDEPAGAPHLLRGGVVGEYNAVCFRCHKKDQWAGRDPHQDSGQKNTGCTLCHIKQPVQGEDRETVSRFVADINILCLACHDHGDHPVGIRHTVMLTAKMPAVSDQLPLGTGRRITCATCHNPHIYPQVGRGLRGVEESAAFCQLCHKL